MDSASSVLPTPATPFHKHGFLEVRRHIERGGDAARCDVADLLEAADDGLDGRQRSGGGLFWQGAGLS